MCSRPSLTDTKRSGKRGQKIQVNTLDKIVRYYGQCEAGSKINK